MSDKKAKYQRKEVSFGGKKHVLWSIDGNTWSSRKDELLAIQERHENEKITFGEIKGIAPKKFPPRKALQGADTEPINKDVELEEMESEVEFASEEDREDGEKSAKREASRKQVPVKEKDAKKEKVIAPAKTTKKDSKKNPAKVIAHKKGEAKTKAAKASPKKRSVAGPTKTNKTATKSKTAKKSGKKAA